MQEIVYFSIAYFLGSIPFGLILSNLFGNKMLRERGSGNIGATNVFRTQGKILGGLTFILDSSKGAIPVLLCANEDLKILVMCIAIFAHMYPVWLKFNGGKGIATFLGALIALNPIYGIVSILTWAIIFFAIKISAVAGLFSCLVGTLLCILNINNVSSEFSARNIISILFVYLLIICRHKTNIRNIFKK